MTSTNLCTIGFVSLCFTSEVMLIVLKFSKFQNEFMMSSFLPKYEPNIVRILPCTMPHYRAEILKIFGSYFGSNYDFINSFWNLLTFKMKFCWKERWPEGRVTDEFEVHHHHLYNLWYVCSYYVHSRRTWIVHKTKQVHFTLGLKVFLGYM